MAWQTVALRTVDVLLANAGGDVSDRPRGRRCARRGLVERFSPCRGCARSASGGDVAGFRSEYSEHTPRVEQTPPLWRQKRRTTSSGQPWRSGTLFLGGPWSECVEVPTRRSIAPPKTQVVGGVKLCERPPAVRGTKPAVTGYGGAKTSQAVGMPEHGAQIVERRATRCAGAICGGFPERSKGSDCKSDGSAFTGSNPVPPIKKDD